MTGEEVYEAFRKIGATQLHHANTVATSCSFLGLGGLASRELVAKRGLPQTPQDSDEIDKKFEIWHCIFVDHVDIHNRAGRVKGPNQYGPVLFVLDLRVLLGLPKETNVFVSKKNPIYFRTGEKARDRWYQSADELAADLQFGNFDKMIVIETPSGLLKFPDGRAIVRLDSPERALQSGVDGRTNAERKLKAAAKKGGVCITISPANCHSVCSCVQKYASYPSHHFEKLFG
jgi:hypothetical protein